MFISLSKTMAKFGGIRVGMGLRMSKKNASSIAIFALFVMIFKMMWFMLKLMWYMFIAVFWLMYAMVYGLVWIYCKMFKTSVPFFKKLYEKFDKSTEKENQA